eukprot:CAMPEP_0170587252 /NCGR_PEP_ID=MMETSP0224-20130122/10186_1 /TAXON_ID=285029 /ORGANISM="Togula jolla, Strain CCCM 725" /LENGTH=394 /DNA_ID=CAMNT_0010910867 /DNA_START=1 /DNA_END=1182 /DNA_ORIENTATION=-
MEERFATIDYYEVLEISSAATDGEIKIAFRRLALKHHPDKATYDKDQATRRFQEIAEAYEVLSDSQLRRRYGEVRQKKSQWTPTAGGFGAGAGRAPGYSSGRRGAPWPGQRYDPEPAMKETESLSSYRRSAMAREIAAEKAKREQEDLAFREQQRREQEHYNALKSSVRDRIGKDMPEEEQDGVWSSWWTRQVQAKWLNSAWEEHLPGSKASSGLQEMLLRDVMRDMKDQRRPSFEANDGRAPGAASFPALRGSYGSDEADLDGEWRCGGKKMVVRNNKINWGQGRSTDITIPDRNVVKMTLHGFVYTGSLDLSRQALSWSDGDVWHRVAPTLKVAPDARPTSGRERARTSSSLASEPVDRRQLIFELIALGFDPAQANSAAERHSTVDDAAAW